MESIFDELYYEMIKEFDNSKFKYDIIKHFLNIKESFYDLSISTFLSLNERDTKIFRQRHGLFNNEKKR